MLVTIKINRDSEEKLKVWEDYFQVLYSENDDDDLYDGDHFMKIKDKIQLINNNISLFVLIVH